MLVIVGSENPVKIRGTERVFKNYKSFGNFEVIGVGINSRVREQPIGRKETYSGATNRARGAFESTTGVKYGVGIEDGIEVLKLDSDVGKVISVCAVYDGKKYFYGEGGSYEIPKKILDKVLDRNITIDEAIVELGITVDKRIGQSEGLISLLTNGAITRQEVVEQGLKMAFAHLFNRKHFT